MKKPLLILACLSVAFIVPVTGQDEKKPSGFRSIPQNMQIPPLMQAQYTPHDAVSLLQYPGTMSEFKITPEQRQKMMEINKFRMEAHQKAMAAMQKAQSSGQFSPQAYQDYKKAQDELNAELDRRLGSLLTPQQQERMKQVQIQMVMKNFGFGALALPQIADTLNLTEKQKDELVDKQIEVQKELRELVQELRAELEERALKDVLTSEQKAKLDKLTGKSFSPKVPDYYEQMLRQQLRPSKTSNLLQGIGAAVERVKKDFQDDDDKDKKKK